MHQKLRFSPEENRAIQKDMILIKNSCKFPLLGLHVQPCFADDKQNPPPCFTQTEETPEQRRPNTLPRPEAYFHLLLNHSCICKTGNLA